MMLKAERWQRILQLVNQAGFVRSEELAQTLDCAEITIRRDLIALAEVGKLVKVHGGAVSNKQQKAKTDVPVGTRTAEAVQQKIRIAEQAAELIDAGSHIYLDAGTSVSMMIPLLEDKDIVVYTHGLHHIPELIAHHIPTYIIGGRLKAETSAAVGGPAIRMIETIRIDYAFMGTNGISPTFGFSTPEQEEATIKQAIIKQAKQVYILADSDKFDQESYIQFAGHQDATIITDQKPNEKYQNFNIITI
ncbi:DeoR/GlpR family DNA-binding transcription regulator [Culicoidibacter larvae]|nr:DeoR/GlpR family DNA-binding transcription regulator [Culicoidibacter larvae]